MVNLSQIKQQIKSADLSRAVRNPGHVLNMNDAYRALKALGWSSALEMHPADRVPVLRRGTASIRRNKDQAGAWIVEIGDAVFDASGDLAQITAEVDQALAGPAEAVYTPGDHVDRAPLSPAALAAQVLAGFHPELAGRLERAVALVEAGQTEFPHYNTRSELWQREPTRYCDCKDAQHRAPWVEGIGVACKHTLAMLLAERVAAEVYNAGTRKRVDAIEMARARQPEPVVAGNGWGGGPADSAQALPAWFGRNDSIEDML